MLVDEPQFMPYGPGSKTVEIVKRIHDGTTPPVLTETALVSLGAAEGNADRIQKGLRFLGLIDAEFRLTDLATALRKATSDEYQPFLANIVQGAYEPIFVSYNPATATGIDLNNAFKPYDPAGQRGNMISLFMALCREAGLAGEAAPRRGRPPVTAGRPKNNAPKNGAKAVAQTNIQPPPLMPPSPKATTKTISLRSGSGEVSLTVSVDLLELAAEDRDFVFRLIDQLRAYELEGPALQRPQPSLNP